MDRQNDNDRETHHNRREWLKGWARWAVLGALAGGAAHVVFRRSDTPSPEDCRNDIACRDCGLLGGCSLPRAALVRQNTRGSR